MTDADADKIILRHWPIEAAMGGQKPTFDTLRAMIREGCNDMLKEAARLVDQIGPDSLEEPGEVVRSLVTE